MFTALRVFNLLVLEEGEEYLTDCPSSLTYSHPYAVHLSAVEATTCPAPESVGEDASTGIPSFRQEVLQRLLQQTLQHSPPERGRLRVCSKSLIFDSHHPSADIIKLPFKRILFLHPLPTSTHNTNEGSSSFPAPSAGRAGGGGGPRSSEGWNSTTLLIAASEITRVPIQLFNGKTRCVRPFTSDCASSSPAPSELDVQRMRSCDGGAAFTSSAASGNTPGRSLSNLSSGALTSSLFSSGASTVRSSWWPGSGAENVAGTPVNVQPGAKGMPASQSPSVFLFLLTFESPRVSTLGSTPSVYSAQSSSAKPRGAASLTALIDGLWRANNGKPLIPHIHRPRCVQRQVPSWRRGRPENAQSLTRSGESNAGIGGSLAGPGGDSLDTPAGVIVDTEDYASEQLHALTQHLTFSLAELDHREQLLLPSNRGYWVRRIRPLIHHRGLLLLTSAAVYFQPHPNFTNSSTKAYPLQSLLHCFRRIQCLRPNALELVLYSGQDAPSASFARRGFSCFSTDVDAGGTRMQRRGQDFTEFTGSGDADANADRWAGKRKTKRPFKLVLLEFENEDEREIVARALQKQKPEAFLVQSSVHYVECMKQLWVDGRLSTYHYLDFLNCIAGRSKSDYSAYPVFPWTIMRFLPTDTSIPVEDEAMRDLSKPVGALEPQRLQALLKRMKEIQVVDYGATGPLRDVDDACEDSHGSHCEETKDRNANSYLYGSHYSTPAFTVHWLVRLVPECQLRLHGGRFDSQQRMFNSMQSACKGALTGQSTFVELIPEFYEFDPSFLVNRLSVFLSPLPSALPLFPSSPHILPPPSQQPPVALTDVLLPPWPAPAQTHATTSTDSFSHSADHSSLSHRRERAETEEGMRGDRGEGEPASSLQHSHAREEKRTDLGTQRAERGDAASFLLHLRQALEGTWTSKHVHNWIDLIFGYKQTGEPARLAHNVFHPLTYANAAAAAATGSCCPLGAQRPCLSPAIAATLEQLQPSALHVQLQEFGQTPIQLFDRPHPMRLACPPFDACAWKEACGHLTHSGRASPSSSPRALAAATCARSTASLSLLAGSSSSRSTSMWGDMPWFVFMHHNRHLLKGLLEAPAVERSLSQGVPLSRLWHLAGQHRPSLPALAEEPGLSRFASKSRDAFLSQGPRPREAASEANCETAAKSELRVAQNGDGCRQRSLGDAHERQHSNAFPRHPATSGLNTTSQQRSAAGSSYPAAGQSNRETKGCREPETVGPVSPHVSSAGPVSGPVSGPVYRERETATAVSSSLAQQLGPSFAAAKPLGLAQSSQSPWAVWLPTRETERRRVCLSKCPARASLTGLALWGETACCIGHDGSVMCFQLKDALHRGGREEGAETETADASGTEKETGNGDSEMATVDTQKGAEEARSGREASGNWKEAGEFERTEKDEEGRIDGGSLRSLAVYRVASVPLCSATFVGSSGVIAVGAFDGSIALHGIHTPQVDYFFGESACDLEESKMPSSGDFPGERTAAALGLSRSTSSPLDASPPSNLALSRPLSRQLCHADSVIALCYNPFLRVLISSSSDATVRVWDVSALATPCQHPSKSLLLLQQVLDDHEGEVTAVASNRHLVLTGSEDGLLLLFDLRLPSQRSGAVWGAHAAGRAPINSCEISDFSAAAILDPAFLADQPLAYSRELGALAASNGDDSEAVLGRSVYSPYAFSPYFGAACSSRDASLDSCVLLPSSFFPVQRWDFRQGGTEAVAAFAKKRTCMRPNGGFAPSFNGLADNHLRGDGDGDAHAMLLRRGARPFCGCLDPTVQYALLAGVRRREKGERREERGGEQGDRASREETGRCAVSSGTEGERERGGGRGGGVTKKPQKQRPFEGYLGLYDLRNRNEEVTWRLQHIEEPAFIATAPSSAELSVMGVDFGAAGLLGCNYIAVGDLHGHIELLAAGDSVGKFTWRG
ncbi:Beige/BEACH domain-containing protein [Toxoplasma gondii VAND]|uniref:Beige/BEACH domain-containing protein n=1 Tax=Toxoplasma gondii VAND TaxID=933077 RepID=A0A086QCM7_TOXGO|nr:Beige/BEACH domain-containing protein [Toxoplasma gondii VAND]